MLGLRSKDFDLSSSTLEPMGLYHHLHMRARDGRLGPEVTRPNQISELHTTSYHKRPKHNVYGRRKEQL